MINLSHRVFHLSSLGQPSLLAQCVLICLSPLLPSTHGWHHRVYHRGDTGWAALLGHLWESWDQERRRVLRFRDAGRCCMLEVRLAQTFSDITAN